MDDVIHLDSFATRRYFMKAYLRFTYPFIVFVVASLLMNACDLQHHGYIYVTDPQNGNTFPLNQPITVKVSVADISRLIPYDWVSYEYTITDDGTTIAHVGNETIHQRNLFVVMNNPSQGAHYVSVRGRAARPDPDFVDVPNNPYRVYSDWIDSNEVCFFVGPNPPPDFCTTRTL